MNETPDTHAQPGGDSVVVSPVIEDTVGVIGLTVVAVFLVVALVKLAQINRKLCEQLLDSAENRSE